MLEKCGSEVLLQKPLNEALIGWYDWLERIFFDLKSLIEKNSVNSIVSVKSEFHYVASVKSQILEF